METSKPAILGGSKTRINSIPFRKTIGKNEINSVTKVLESDVLSAFIGGPGEKFLGGKNVIDFENLTIHEPEIVNDLPAGGRRLVQKASGYSYTIVSGQVAFKDGEATGELNGQLIRSS